MHTLTQRRRDKEGIRQVHPARNVFYSAIKNQRIDRETKKENKI
jgi:hypothetical protein